MPEFQLISFWRVEFCCVGKYLADQKLRATFCLNNSIEMETLTLQKCILLKQIFLQLETNMIFFVQKKFSEKANCFKSWGEKRLQKVDLFEYIFLPQNFLRRVMPTKTSRKRMRSRGARKEYATYGGKFSFFDWNSTKQYAAFAIHTLIFRWAPFNLKFKFAIFFGRFPLNFLRTQRWKI